MIHHTKHGTPEHIALLSARSAAAWRDPAKRKARVDGILASWDDPLAHALRSGGKRPWVSERMRALWASPAYRLRIVASMTAAQRRRRQEDDE